VHRIVTMIEAIERNSPEGQGCEPVESNRK